MSKLKKDDKIFIAGHNGMVGSAIYRLLETRKHIKIITRSRSQLDLCDQVDVKNFMAYEQPDEVIIAAAKVGGIHANNMYPANFIYDNLQIQSNLIHCSHLQNVQKLLFLGSSCIYPKYAQQPIKENVLLTGCSRGVGLETTKILLNRGYNVYGISRKLTSEFEELLTAYPNQVYFKSYDLVNVVDIQKEIFKKNLGTYYFKNM